MCIRDRTHTDHTPGYGSAAKYIGTTIKELVRDSTIYDLKSVTIVEIMGRNAGWLTAAAALAEDEDCEGAAMICLPEIPFDPDPVSYTHLDVYKRQRPPRKLLSSEFTSLPCYAQGGKSVPLSFLPPPKSAGCQSSAHANAHRATYRLDGKEPNQRAPSSRELARRSRD